MMFLKLIINKISNKSPIKIGAFNMQLTNRKARRILCDRITLTHSSSFSIPVGIWGTALLMAAKSGKSGTSSVLKMGIGLVASSARARNDNLLIMKSNARTVHPPYLTTLEMCGRSYITSLIILFSIFKN